MGKDQQLLILLYIELTISFLIGLKRTVNFRIQRLWHHNCRLYNNHVKVTGNNVMYDRGAWFLRVIMSSSLALSRLPSVKKHKHECLTRGWGTGSRSTGCGKRGVWWKTQGSIFFRQNMNFPQWNEKPKFCYLILRWILIQHLGLKRVAWSKEQIKHFVKNKTIQEPTCRAYRRLFYFSQ